MNTIEQFREVIEGEFGITNLEQYTEYKKQRGDKFGGITAQEVNRLSPDNIDSGSFWEYIEKNPELAKDAIAFGITKDKTREDVNAQNFRVACTMGVFDYILMCRDLKGHSILDIGAGYGMLKEFVQKYTQLDYWGVDVYPKIEGVLKVGSDGSTLPPEIMSPCVSNKFTMVVSCNVFQHLSIKQRRHYYEQVAQILAAGGVFTVTQCYESAIHKGFSCKDTGRQYMCHYGQYTEVQTYQEIIEDLQKHFNILSVQQRCYDNSILFNCNHKPIQTYAEFKTDKSSVHSGD